MNVNWIAVAGLALAPMVSNAYAITDSALISDGNILLGVNDTGSLNAPGGPPSPVDGTTLTGLRFTPTGNEATAHGCSCEGWGVGIGETGVWGGDGNDNTGGAQNLAIESFTSTGTSATSVVTLTSGELRITHNFELASETDDLYRVTVTIENTSGVDIADLRYTRAMDWDVEPTTFNEFSTIQGTAAATAVAFAGANGFDSTNPFDPRGSDGFVEGDFVDEGPTDHGAIFDFAFGALTAGSSKTFEIFYGGSATERGALLALNAVGAEVYSLGQPSSDSLGTGLAGTNTFIFGFAGVGGVVVPPPIIPVPAAAWLLGGALGLLGATKLRRGRTAA